MNPTAAYLAELKTYVADQRRRLESTRHRSPDILLCPFHNFCFYEETLGHCKEWIPEPTPDWLSPDYESNVSEWYKDTTDIPLITIDELPTEHNDVLANNLRHLLGNRRNSLHQFDNRGTNPQPSAPSGSVLPSTTAIDSLEIPLTAHRLVDPARNTSTHRYPLRSLHIRTPIKNITTSPGPAKLGRDIARQNDVLRNRMDDLEHRIQGILNANTTLFNQVQNLQAQNQELKKQQDERHSDSHLRSAVKSAKPNKYDGNRDKLTHFINSLSLYVAMERKGLSDKELIIVALSFMKKGRAVTWAENYIETGNMKTQTYKDFVAALRDSFGNSDIALTAQMTLDLLKQGSNSVTEYITTFEQHEGHSQLGEVALISAFKKGLNGPLLDKIHQVPDLPSTLKSWKSFAQRALTRQNPPGPQPPEHPEVLEVFRTTDRHQLANKETDAGQHKHLRPHSPSDILSLVIVASS
jgi:hypothetical protein